MKTDKGLFVYCPTSRWQNLKYILQNNKNLDHNLV